MENFILDGCRAVQREGSQTRTTWEPRLATGLDTLKMTFWVDFSNSLLFHQLEEAKKKAQNLDIESEPINLGDYEFNVMRTGVQMFQFRLVRGDIRVLLSPRKHTSNIPNCRLEIGSVSCWTPGYNKVVEDFKAMLEMLGGVFCKEKVSEAHLCADAIGQDIKKLPVANQDQWITRAQTFSPHYRHRKLTGVSIGSGDLMLRIYDKVEELKKKSQHKIIPFMQIWGLDDIEKAKVTRIEFQVRRSILKEFKFNGQTKRIDTLEDLNNSLSSIWSYLVEEWAKLTETPVDRKHNHQSRAGTHEFWEQIREADFSGDEDVERVTSSPMCDLVALKLQMAGIGMTIAAALGRKKDDLETIIAFSQGALEGTIRGLFKDKDDFIKRMERKVNRVQPFRDALAVAHAM